MTNGLNKLIIFAAGAALGSAVTWKLIKTKYEKLAQEEIASVREVYEGPRESNKTQKSEDSEEEDESEEDRYREILARSGYLEEQDEEYDEDDIREEEYDMVIPYVISPEMNEEEDYETETLYYFKDGVVTDMYHEVIEDVEPLIGNDFMNHFGEYEDDSVIVRNENIKKDFEILRDNHRYSEID